MCHECQPRLENQGESTESARDSESNAVVVDTKPSSAVTWTLETSAWLEIEPVTTTGAMCWISYTLDPLKHLDHWSRNFKFLGTLGRFPQDLKGPEL